MIDQLFILHVSQRFFFCFFFFTSDFIVLTIMAHDRYIAICNPLQYERIMHKGACLQMVATGLIFSLIYTCGTFANTFCSNVINQFFCEVPQLLKISCSDLYLVETGLLLLGCTMAFGCFVFIIVTYMQIFRTVFRMPSVHGQKKALSTCFPHVTVVTLFISSTVFAYARPPSGTSCLDIVLR
ncbi:olfactory receptor 14A2-like [Anolis carolinensis]|uniref:olfactory receptor 14A2-like n=1 Tax=Anolis carolinensis TaxID=28377 RepID=UPI002F2B34F7